MLCLTCIVPGVSEYMYLNSNAQNSLPQPWMKPLDPDDLELITCKLKLTIVTHILHNVLFGKILPIKVQQI